LRQVGIDESYRKGGHALYTVETHVTHQAEAKVLEAVYVASQVLSVDDKRVHLFHWLRRQRDDTLLATGEQIYLHVDSAAGKAAAFDTALHRRLQALQAAHAELPVPPQKGRYVGMAR